MPYRRRRYGHWRLLCARCALRHLARIRRAPGYVLGVALRHLARIRPAILLSSHPELLPLSYDTMYSQISLSYRFVPLFLALARDIDLLGLAVEMKCRSINIQGYRIYFSVETSWQWT